MLLPSDGSKIESIDKDVCGKILQSLIDKGIVNKTGKIIGEQWSKHFVYGKRKKATIQECIDYIQKVANSQKTDNHRPTLGTVKSIYIAAGRSVEATLPRGVIMPKSKEELICNYEKLEAYQILNRFFSLNAKIKKNSVFFSNPLLILELDTFINKLLPFGKVAILLPSLVDVIKFNIANNLKLTQRDIIGFYYELYENTIEFADRYKTIYGQKQSNKTNKETNLEIRVTDNLTNQFNCVGVFANLLETPDRSSISILSDSRDALLFKTGISHVYHSQELAKDYDLTKIWNNSNDISDINFKQQYFNEIEILDFTPLIDAMAAIQNRNIVHKDIKPNNIILRRDSKS